RPLARAPTGRTPPASSPRNGGNCPPRPAPRRRTGRPAGWPSSVPAGVARAGVGRIFCGRPAVGRRWRAAVQLGGDGVPALRAGPADDVVADRARVARPRIAPRARERGAPDRILRIVAPARGADPLRARFARPPEAVPDRRAPREPGGPIG